MGTKLRLFVLTLSPLFWPGSLLVACLTNDTLSKPPTVPGSTTRFSHTNPNPTPLLRHLPQPKPMASLPGSSATQTNQPSQQQVSISCSADVKLINPAHAQLLSSTTLPNLRPTASTASSQSACYPVLNNRSVYS